MLYGTAVASGPKVYLQPLESGLAEAGASRIPVSTRGSTVPPWRGDHAEIYDSQPDGMIRVVPLTPGTHPPGSEKPLFRAILRPTFRPLDAIADGQHFLVNVLAWGGDASIVVVSGWERELGGSSPTGVTARRPKVVVFTRPMAPWPRQRVVALPGIGLDLRARNAIAIRFINGALVVVAGTARFAAEPPARECRGKDASRV